MCFYKILLPRLLGIILIIILVNHIYESDRRKLRIFFTVREET